MDKAKTLLALYNSKALPNLDIDDMLVIGGKTHRWYREYLHSIGAPLYAVTRGLQEEVATGYTGGRQLLAKRYHLTVLEVNYCIYGTRTSISTLMKRERAKQLRLFGCTELQLIEEGLPPDISLLSAEITAKRDDGIGVQELAEEYGYTIGRISQLDTGSSKKKRLSKDEKEAIRVNAHGLAASVLAKLYGVTVNTIYVVQREKQCRSI